VLLCGVNLDLGATHPASHKARSPWSYPRGERPVKISVHRKVEIFLVKIYLAPEHIS